MAGIQVQAGSPPVPWHPPRIVRLPGPVTSASQGRSTVGQGQARPPSEGPGPTQSPAVTSLQAEVWPGNLGIRHRPLGAQRSVKAACTLWGCQKYVLDLHGCTGGQAGPDPESSLSRQRPTPAWEA